MRLRSLLGATAASTLLVAGVASSAVQADPAPAPDLAGPLVTWGDSGDPAAGAALAVPADLTTLVADVAVTDRATAVVTADGRLRVWGKSGAPEVDQAPTGVTDAVSVSLTAGGGSVIHKNGAFSAWGSADLADVPDLPSFTNGVQASAVAGDTGYYVTGAVVGALGTWGAAPPFPMLDTRGPGLKDVSAGPFQVLALREDGGVFAWGDPQIPEFGQSAVPDFGGLKATQIATGPGADGVVLEDGTIRIWGPAVPPGQPDLTGKKVISLSLGTNAGAVTDDGVVHTWGSEGSVNAVPASLAGQPVESIAMGAKHAAVIVAYRMRSAVAISGTPQVGHTLTSTAATYTLPPATTSGQWYAGTLPIKGQTGTTLTVDDSLVGSSISYKSTATRGGVALRSESAQLGPVIRAGSAITLTVSPATAAAGKTRTATATVTRLGGTPAGTVTFRIGSRTRIVALSGGKATWTLPRLATGSHQVTATYSGSPSSDPSTAAPVNLRVTKAASAVRAKARSSAKKVRIAVTVKTNRRVSPQGRVTVTLAGRKVTARLDARGRAVVTVKQVKRGKHTAKVAYAGNGSVSGSNGSVKFRV